MRTALLLAILIFVLTVLVRLPARALAPLLPSSVSCTAASGTLWQGRCAEFRSGDWVLDDLSWTLHPWTLLRLRLSADINSPDARAAGRAHVEFSAGGVLSIDALDVQLPLPNQLGLFPRGWSGSVHLALAHARLRDHQLQAIIGRVTASNLHMPNPPAEVGSYELVFAPVTDGSPMRGELRDLAGPLAVTAQLTLSDSAAYSIQGLVAAHDSADAQLAQVLQLLGPADAQRRRAFALAGHY